MMDTEEFCLRWNNHHSVLVSVLDKLLEKESMCDVTLAADHQFVRVHRLVLCACSQYFEEMLSNQADKQAFIFLKDVSFPDLKALVDYMYKGEVNVAQEHLTSFLQTAEALDIKGLAYKTDEESQPAPRPKPSQMARSSGMKRTLEPTTTTSPSSALTTTNNSHRAERERTQPSRSRQPPAKKAHTMPQESSIDTSNLDSDDHFVAVHHKVESEMEMDNLAERVESEWASQDGDEDWSSSDIGIVSILPNSDSTPSASANVDYGPESKNDNATVPSGTKPKTNNSSSASTPRGDEMNETSVERIGCPNCDRTYKSKKFLYRHLRAGCDETTDCHSVQTSQLPIFRCCSCPYVTYLKGSLLRHTQNAHGQSI